ncbi:GNAT family N-acetyltransferase [Paenibacillus dendritiformis]|uniref:GNAT family N-acetyltransferase n=1 Tax=Paenibacillus TaxID=44249 RepID=UPI00105A0E27|nr:GNAT family N-acetyltransferase [Paenibacillus dendritiformis]TDL53821.1 GNAT family N-acetyltransferase [Paenibacillus dendritiformis]WGU95760.1 GNAT family N-acetyltransferase [Paenibacillus dendritiformis]
MTNRPKLFHSTPEESKHVLHKLIEFNAKCVPNAHLEEVNLCLKDDNGEIVAGLNSAVLWNWMEVDILWVDENHRGEGLGRRLLEEAEQIARAKNCTFIKLNTFSFQAPEFYKKYGYEVVAIFENAPIGCKHYYYKKDLT